MKAKLTIIISFLVFTYAAILNADTDVDPRLRPHPIVSQLQDKPNAPILKPTIPISKPEPAPPETPAPAQPSASRATLSPASTDTELMSSLNMGHLNRRIDQLNRELSQLNRKLSRLESKVDRYHR